MKFMNSPLSVEQMTAVILIIAESAKSAGIDKFDPDNFELPYEIYEDDRGVHFNLEKMPNDLKWILYKFSTMTTD